MTIKAGTALLQTSANAAGTGTITIGDTSGSADATLKTSVSTTYTNPITVAGGNTGTLTIDRITNSPNFGGTITLANNLTLKNSAGSGGTNFIISGNITGTGNIITNATLTGPIVLSGASIDNIGTITNSGTGAGTVTISAVIGTAVTGVTQNSSTSALTLSGVNTYTGPITNSAGTLNLTQTTAYSTMTLAGDTTTTFTNGKTFTLSSLVSTATSGHVATIQSASAGNAFTLSDTAGTNAVSYMSIKDSTATGGATWNAFTDNGNVNVSGNTGWNFTPPIADAYWVGGTGNWSDATNHWATTSNGTPGAGNIPVATTNVHFDSSSGTGTVTVNSSSVTVANLDESSTNITIDTSTNGITATGDITVNKTISSSGGTPGALTLSGLGPIAQLITGGSAGTISAPVTLNVNSTVAVATGTFTMSGVISGASYGVAKTGANTLTLSGANTFSGQLTVSAGTLKIATINNVSANGTLGNSALPVILGSSGNTGTLEYTGATATSTKPFTMAASGTGAILIDTASASLTLSGVIDGSGALVMAGGSGSTNTLILSGNNTFSGGLYIKAGTVYGQTSATVFGASTAADSITLGCRAADSATCGSANATLEAWGSVTFTNPITVASGSNGTMEILNYDANNTFSGAILLNNNLTLMAKYGPLTVTGGITGTGNLTLISSTYDPNISLSTNPINMVGTITNASTNTGTVTISASIGSSVTGIDLNATAGGTLLSGTSINPTGTITNRGSTTATTTISGVIGTNVTGVVQNSATSSLVLSGTNTFTSGLAIKAGTVKGGVASNAFGADSSVITIGETGGSADASLQNTTAANPTFANPITVASGTGGRSIVSNYPANLNSSGLITLNNNLTITNGNLMTFSGGVGGTGNLIINNNYPYNANGTVTFLTTSVNNTGTITNSGTGIAPTTISAVIGANVTGITQSSATSALTLSGVNTYTGPITNSAGTLNLTQTTTYSTMTLAGDTTTKLTAGKTFTLTSLVSNGTSGHLANLQSSVGGSTAAVTTASAQIATDYLAVTDVTAVQASTWYAGANGSLSGTTTNWGLAPNTTPNAPTLVSPANASYTADTTPTLSANYSDSDTGDAGTTNYRISSSSLADCTANTNVVAWGASSATATNNESTTWTNSTSIGSDATYYWCAQNNDGVATSSWTQMGSFTLDTTAPTTAADAGSYTFGADTTENVTVTLTCVDADGSGCGATLYCADTDNSCTPATVYATPVTISTVGTNYIRYASTDFVSNAETAKSQTIKIVQAQTSSATTTTPGAGGGNSNQNFVSQVAQQVQNIVSTVVPSTTTQQTQITYPPIAESVPQEPQPVFQGSNIISKAQLEKIEILPLPESVKELAIKFPKFAETLEKVGIEKPEDIKKLEIAKLSFPGLSEASGLTTPGVSPSQFTAQEKQNIPTNITFAQVGNENIDLNIKVAISQMDAPVQSINTIQGKPLYLVVKPERPAESVKGYVIFKSANSKAAFLDYTKSLPASLSAAIMEATGIKPNTEEINANTEVLAQKDIVLSQFDYEDNDGDGIWTATTNSPAVDGKYEIKTVLVYAPYGEKKTQTTEELSMIMVVDPEGYVYENTIDGRETRISGATASIYWLNPDTKEYEVWPAEKYQQQNSQVTDNTGKYSFLVPEGMYYLKVEAKDYLTYQGEPFEVSEGKGIHQNIQLTVKNWWARVFTIERVMIGIVIILLLGIFILLILKRIKNGTTN